jgi:hypothetical protein
MWSSIQGALDFKRNLLMSFSTLDRLIALCVDTAATAAIARPRELVAGGGVGLRVG